MLLELRIGDDNRYHNVAEFLRDLADRMDADACHPVEGDRWLLAAEGARPSGDWGELVCTESPYCGVVR